MIEPVQHLLVDPVTDLLINGHDEVWVADDAGLRLTDVTFADDEEVRAVAVRIATLAGRPLDDAHPYVDVDHDGLRVHAILPPLVAKTHISIRRIRHRQFSLTQLLGDNDVVDDLKEIVTTRRNFLISGGTGAGKTTLLSALVSEIPATSRIAVIEDTREVVGHHPHVIGLQARLANSEGRGEVTMRDLVRQSLRMRPDHIFVGEVRSGEVIDLLAALNTGHPGSGGTIHANSAQEVPARIEAMSIFAGVPADAARRLFYSAIDVVIHLRNSLNRGVESISLVNDGQLLPLTRYSLSGHRC